VAKGTPDELTILAAASLVDRSPETVRRWVWSGRLKARKIGKRLLVPRGDVVALAGVAPADKRLTLREWGDLAARVLHRSKGGRRSASDLVLNDRRDRSAEHDARR